MDDDLLSIAFSSNNYSCSSSSSLDSRSSSWNHPSPHHHFHALGVFNQHLLLHSPPSPSPCMDEDYLCPALLPSSDQCHQDTCLQSTGYLEDVLSEFCSKRRRLLTFSDQCHNTTTSQFDHNTSITYVENYWTQSNDVILEGSMTDVKTTSEEEGISENNTFTHDEYSSSPSSSSQKLENAPPQKGNLHCVDPIFSSEGGGGEGRKKRRSAGEVAYPFAMVKPGGCEGDITLKDINKRILMPPTRAVRHPVGDYACRPMITPEGPGLSGKAVVAFTRIHTRGTGTITIIRTRG